MDKKERYCRNVESFSWQELANIRQKSVCVVGCGGLGGHVCHALARFGIGGLTLVDGDVFAESNLNRQLFATTKTLGQNKALATQEALQLVNPDVAVTARPTMLRPENAEQLVHGHHLVVDCLDSVAPRLVLGKACARLKLPLVHGAIAGFYGQVAVVLPGSDLLERLYPPHNAGADGLDKKLGSPAFTPQLVAALQCSETLKFLAGRGTMRPNAVLHVDLLNNCFQMVEYAE